MQPDLNTSENMFTYMKQKHQMGSQEQQILEVVQR